MARRKADVTDVPSERLEKLKEESSKLTGLDKALLDDMLIEYDALSGMCDELRADVERDGVMIEKTVGTVNNRRKEMVENPAFTAYQKAVGRKGDLAKKLSDFAKRSDGGEQEEDELESFIRR